MPPIIRAVITLNAQSGVARDNAMMDLVFDTPSVDLIVNLTNLFTTAAVGASHPLGFYLSNFLSGAAGGLVIRQYDITSHLNGSAAGPPISTTTQTGPANPANSGLPNQVCAAVSYHAVDFTIPEHGPGTRPRARYRGRVFFGPLQTICFGNDGSGRRVVLTSTFMNDLAKAFGRLLTAEPGWSVWSRKGAFVHQVAGGWVDDTFDTQRRRKADPVSRLTWP